MCSSDLIDEYMARFTKNPYWKAYLDNAPDSAKEYIRMGFAYSLLDEEERTDEKFNAARDKLRNGLSVDAVKYLYENEKNMTAKNIYKKMLDSMTGKVDSGGWKGVWVSDAIYAAAPDLAKRYYENVRWVEFIGKDEPPAEQDGRKMTQPKIFTKMQDADWDYIFKHIHSYARGMPVAMARRHYQHKTVLGNPIDADNSDKTSLRG